MIEFTNIRLSNHCPFTDKVAWIELKFRIENAIYSVDLSKEDAIDLANHLKLNADDLIHYAEIMGV